MEYQFADHLMDFIRRMPPKLPIMRLTTDTPENELIAPKWNMDKQKFRNYVIKTMEEREWRQGDLYPDHKHNEPPKNLNIKETQTDDGSITFWNQDIKEHYHDNNGAKKEAEEKYVKPSELNKFLMNKPMNLLDICFGLGYNSLTSIESVSDSSNQLNITALELDRRIVKEASNTLLFDKSNVNWNLTLKELYENGYSNPCGDHNIKVHFGDARYTISFIEDQSIDLVFLDAFSSSKCSECWTVNFFKEIKRIMHPEAQLFTYSSAGPIRSGLLMAGFYIGETLPKSNKYFGTQASQNQSLLKYPLSKMEIQLLNNTTRGIPFFDPNLIWTHREIMRNREKQIIKFKS